MKETKLTSEQLNLIEQNNGLKMYLNGLLTGREATPRSNLYNLDGKTKLMTPDEILASWKDQLSSLEGGTDFEQKVYQFDLHQLEKWGPQGEVLPIADLMDDVVIPTYHPETKFSLRYNDLWKEAKSIVTNKLYRAGAYNLQPVSYDRVIDDMRARDTLESNSGWPLFTGRKKPEVIKASIADAKSGAWKTYPAIALFRNYNQKTRLVWMFPMSANLVEGSFTQPLQSALMRSSLAGTIFAPWTGFEQVRRLMTDAYNNKFAVAASDFSSTDAHFQLDTSLEVFDTIKWCFQNKYWGELKESICYMHTIPLIVGPDTMFVGEHGVSSGSNWTNFIETIFDMILGEFVALSEGKRQRCGSFDPTATNGESRFARSVPGNVYSALYAIGDDMTWCVKSDHYDPNFAKRLEKYGARAGQIIKADKTTNDLESVKSLQRLFQDGYLRSDGQIRAVYPTIRALKSLVYPERFHSPKTWSKDMEAVRAFMILENCVDHPLFEEFCRFVSDGDPNLRVVARMKRVEQNRLTAQSKSVRGLVPTYTQEKRDQSLATMASVQFISTL